MSYKETIEWMYQQLPMYQREGKSAYKADLNNTIALAKHLGNPELDFKSIHIGGTNGKGSTSHMLASVFIESGYKVGLYTSPHLKDFRERIKVNGQMIEKSYVVDFITKHKSFLEAHGLSFFEMTVGLAFNYFKDSSVDVAIIEVGLGGRLDSTNIITPEIAAITNIGYDHMQFLGNTLEKISSEKAGIIKPNIPIVIGETLPETKAVFKTKARKENAPIFFADETSNNKCIETDLKGNYQQKNLRTATKLIDLIKNSFNQITTETIHAGLTNVVRNTGLEGRWQVLGENPYIVADTAHNKEGLITVIEQINSISYDDLLVVLGFVNDKNVSDLLSLFPRNAKYFLCEPNIRRAMPVAELNALALEVGLDTEVYNTVNEAFNAAKELASNRDFIFVGGSTFVVAEVV